MIVVPDASVILNFGVTSYDASYHATALVSGGVLASADDRLRRTDYDNNYDRKRPQLCLSC